jgi:hypothetical protein
METLTAEPNLYAPTHNPESVVVEEENNPTNVESIVQDVLEISNQEKIPIEKTIVEEFVLVTPVETTNTSTEEQQGSQVVASDNVSEDQSETESTTTDLKEKDENVCDSNPTTSKEVGKVTNNGAATNNKKTDIYIAKLIEELIKERNKLVDLGIIKRDQATNNVVPNDTVAAAATTTKSAREVLTPQQQQPEDQENQDPKVEKEITSAVTTKVVQSHKTASSKVRLSLLTQSQKQSALQTPVGQQTAGSTKQQNEKTEEYTIEEESRNENSGPSACSLQPAVAKKDKVQQAPSLPVANLRFEEILDVNRSYVNFGLNLPGQISEESLEIVNKSNENIVVQIIIECQNAELQDTDEYVFSIRRTHLYDYNDKHLLLMSPYSSAAFKLALKVPNMRLKEMIRGQAVFSIQGLNKSSKMPLEATVCIPKLFCPKELYHTQLKCTVIKLAIKSGKKQENKIPIKNNSPIPMTLELDFFKPKSPTGEPVVDPLECYCFPGVVSIPAHGMGIIGILIKPKAQNIYMPGGADHEKKYTSVKKVLLAKCRESSLIYSFVLWIESHH